MYVTPIKKTHSRHQFIALIGPYPPQYGGVPVHIKRLRQQLIHSGVYTQIYCQPRPRAEVEEGITPVLPHLSWKRWLLQYGWRCTASIIHCHGGWQWSPAMYAMLLLGKKVIFTFHDQMTIEKWSHITKSEQLAAKELMKSESVYWIGVSEPVKMQLIALGVIPSRIRVIPAYIAPTFYPDASSKLPFPLRSFIQAHSPVLSAYGFRLTFDQSGIDLYGFDLCINAVKRLKPQFPDIGLILCIPDVSNSVYFNELRQMIVQNDVQANVFFQKEPLEEAYPIWQVSDVYVRPTITDGDSLTIREALSLGTPVVASDVSPRPKGTVLFRNRDLESLISAIRQVIYSKSTFTQLFTIERDTDYYSPILNLYCELTPYLAEDYS